VRPFSFGEKIRMRESEHQSVSFSNPLIQTFGFGFLPHPNSSIHGVVSLREKELSETALIPYKSI
jgi:hypothetical protein